MSKFETTKQKLRRAWEKSKENEDKLNLQQDINNQILKRLKKLNTVNTEIKKIIDLSSDWNNLDILLEDSEGNALYGWLNYKFTFLTLDEKLVSVLKPQFVRRFGVGSISNPNGTLLAGTSLTESYLYKLTELPNNLKQIDANFTITLQNLGGLQDDIQFKLIFQVSNPALYYKA